MAHYHEKRASVLYFSNNFIYLCTVFNVASIVGKFNVYSIPLKALTTNSQDFEYDLNNDYFSKIDSAEVRKGDLHAVVSVKKHSTGYELIFEINGFTIISCDRCLDDMEQSVSIHEKLFVKFGKTFSEEGTDIVIVPEDEGEINIAWFLYEFIVLAIPIKHVHPPGKCNKAMTSQLRKHTAKTTEESDDNLPTEESETYSEPEEPEHDARWDKLKDMIDND
jgi:uncharacterized metal-binding protein YceD (DUF177 family)